MEEKNDRYKILKLEKWIIENVPKLKGCNEDDVMRVLEDWRFSRKRQNMAFKKGKEIGKWLSRNQAQEEMAKKRDAGK